MYYYTFPPNMVLHGPVPLDILLSLYRKGILNDGNVIMRQGEKMSMYLGHFIKTLENSPPQYFYTFPPNMTPCGPVPLDILLFLFQQGILNDKTVIMKLGQNKSMYLGYFIRLLDENEQKLPENQVTSVPEEKKKNATIPVFLFGIFLTLLVWFVILGDSKIDKSSTIPSQQKIHNQISTPTPSKKYSSSSAKIKDECFGTSTREEMDMMLKLHNSKATQSLEEYGTRLILLGKGRFFKKGENVKIIDWTWSGMRKVLADGEIQGYWIPYEFVEEE